MAVTEIDEERIEYAFIMAFLPDLPENDETADKALEAWNLLWELMKREDNFSDQLGSRVLDWQIGNWANDTTMLLQNTRRYKDVIAVNEQILKIQWSTKNDKNLFHENAKREIADTYADMGETEKAYKLYEEYLVSDPLWGWGWIGYYRLFKDNRIEFPLMIGGKSKRISVMAKLTERQKALFSDAKLGTMRIVVKNHTLVAQIVYEIAEPELKSDGNVMGVDLGIKCPAVSYCSDGTVKFYGNGRKNNHSLHTWSFYRLAQFIEYKAKLAGISVEYVNPAYTSQKCPVCGSVHHADDRNYACGCGFHIHRDLLGAMNIESSTGFVGNRQTA